MPSHSGKTTSKAHKTEPKAKTADARQDVIYLPKREAELLTKAMGAKTPREALAKAVELATRKGKR